MMQKTALITGVQGQDGQLLASRLISRGYRVFGVIRKGQGLLESLRAMGVTCTECDISDPASTDEVMSSLMPNHVYHIAAAHHSSLSPVKKQQNVNQSLALNDEMVKTNFLSTQNFIHSILKHSPETRFLFAASSQMYTPLADVYEVNETTPKNPSTFYGHTKMWSMDLINYHREKNGIKACAAILFNHESPLRKTDFLTRKITSAVAKIKNNLENEIEINDIGAKADWSGAVDFVGAMNLMLESEESRDFVLASGTLHSVKDVLEFAFSAADLDWRKYTRFKLNTAHVKALVGNPSLAHKSLGWRPTLDLKTLIVDMVNYDLNRLQAGEA